ncbi:MAG: hypothetical protein V4561_00755 [Bacteroidota bacterium]
MSKNKYLPVEPATDISNYILSQSTIVNLNFDIKPSGTISDCFLMHGITRFAQAAEFVKQLPYGRNKNKNNLTSLFTDNCGTCSTKHALLKLLADENKVSGLKLILGLFRMNRINTPKISATLKLHHLEYIPEAHNYLKWENKILDFTNRNSKAEDFEGELIEEIEIQPYQITDFKIAYHKQYLDGWLKEQASINLSTDELWMIREQCIADLSV